MRSTGREGLQKASFGALIPLPVVLAHTVSAQSSSDSTLLEVPFGTRRTTQVQSPKGYSVGIGRPWNMSATSPVRCSPRSGQGFCQFAFKKRRPDTRPQSSLSWVPERSPSLRSIQFPAACQTRRTLGHKRHRRDRTCRSSLHGRTRSAPTYLPR